MGRTILIIGGARSGKSALAEQLAGRERKVAYVATASALDDEMRERIRRHRRRRPKNWTTFEQQLEIDKLLPSLSEDYDAILIDCMVLYVTNMLLGDELERVSDAAILSAVDHLLRASRLSKADVLIVSNEVGCGIVPEADLARHFRDVMGLANQRLAAGADEVYHVVAGIAQRIKPPEAAG